MAQEDGDLKESMLTKTLHRFRVLPDSTRAMVYLYWIYEFSQIIVGLFINIFVFELTQSLFSLALYNLVFFFFVALGFSGWGYMVAQRQISLRYNYLRAFTIYTVSFLLLLFFPRDFSHLLLFAAFNGLGLGMFWVGVHSYEMLTTTDKNRDFYSSMVSLGTQIFSILSPLIATASFYLSEYVFHLESFEILFWLLPFVYLCSFPFLFKLPEYTPKRIPHREWKRLFFAPNLRPIRAYILAGGLPWGFRSTLIPALSLLSLKTVLNIGVLQTVVGGVSILTLLFLSHKRHEGNRVTILFYAVLLLSLSFGLLFFWDRSPAFFIVFSLVLTVVSPIYRVSEHVIDLQTMDRLTGDHSFYPGLVYRDILIWVGRTLAIGFLCVLLLFTSEEKTLLIGVGAIIASYWLVYFRAKRFQTRPVSLNASR
ncbi:MAG: MFS transporter [Candidatus Gracilibacteria bacterium]|jgi:MFS family permease